MTKQHSNLFIFVLMGLFLASVSCSKQPKKSANTGWKYNDPKWGGFERAKYKDQETGPGLVYIEGGTFMMGQFEQDLMYERNNLKRRVSVPNFYMDETEVTNFNYLEYLYWLQRVY